MSIVCVVLRAFNEAADVGFVIRLERAETLTKMTERAANLLGKSVCSVCVVLFDVWNHGAKMFDLSCDRLAERIWNACESELDAVVEKHAKLVTDLIVLRVANAFGVDEHLAMNFDEIEHFVDSVEVGLMARVSIFAELFMLLEQLFDCSIVSLAGDDNSFDGCLTPAGEEIVEIDIEIGEENRNVLPKSSNGGRGRILIVGKHPECVNNSSGHVALVSQESHCLKVGLLQK